MARKLSAAEGPKELVISLTSKTSFADLVKVLERTLVIDKEIFPRGCNPCLSGIDRIVLEDPALRKIR
jgi:hypothetical protein